MLSVPGERQKAALPQVLGVEGCDSGWARCSLEELVICSNVIPAARGTESGKILGAESTGRTERFGKATRPRHGGPGTPADKFGPAPRSQKFKWKFPKAMGIKQMRGLNDGDCVNWKAVSWPKCQPLSDPVDECNKRICYFEPELLFLIFFFTNGRIWNFMPDTPSWLNLSSAWIFKPNRSYWSLALWSWAILSNLFSQGNGQADA